MVCRQLFTALLATTLWLEYNTNSVAQNIIQLTGQNVFAGNSAGAQNTSGVNGVFLGYQSGRRNTSGGSNTFIGSQAGQANTTGGSNIFSGAQAGFSNTTGSFNVFTGPQAGANNTTGNYNMLMGNAAGNANVSGSYNIAIGDGAGYRNNAFQNTYIGTHAGFNNQSGNNNTFIGQDVGLGITVGGNNTFIGWQANSIGANAGSLTNATAIGANAQVSISNALVLGNNANVGIGNSEPSSRLHITTGVANTSGLRLQNLTNGSPASVTNQYKFLTVDGAGNVILGSINGSAREAAADGLWQRQGGYLQSVKDEAVVIGRKANNIPAGYRLFVEEGILTEKVKVALKNTAEWSDRVFDNSYELKTLNQVEQYIQENQHLPGIPSAKEMVEKGNDLHKTDAKLLEKIEELTLYSIQLEKTNQQQNQELKVIKQKQVELEQLVKQLLKR